MSQSGYQFSGKKGSSDVQEFAQEPYRQEFAPFRVRHIWLAVVGFAVFVFGFGVLFDLFLLHVEKVSQLSAALLLDALFASVLGFSFYKLLMYDRERRIRIVARLETIDEMNHHIRNALQVISFNAHTRSNDFELAEIKRAVTRIQWALREVLPKVEPEFDSFEGSAKTQATDSDKSKDGLG
jgi:hypothetical protein